MYHVYDNNVQICWQGRHVTKKEAPDSEKGSQQQYFFIFCNQMIKRKANQTVEERYIIFSNVSKGTAVLHQGVTNIVVFGN